MQVGHMTTDEYHHHCENCASHEGQVSMALARIREILLKN